MAGNLGMWVMCLLLCPTVAVLYHWGSFRQVTSPTMQRNETGCGMGCRLQEPRCQQRTKVVPACRRRWCLTGQAEVATEARRAQP
jgi:hypothetical protein